MRVETEHRFLVEIVREPSGDLLAQEPLDDLGHLVAEARYQAVSRGRQPDEPGRLSARLEPIGRDGTPALDGLRLTLRHDGREGGPVVIDFPKEVAANRGTELAAALMAAETLKEGDTYRVRLACTPRPPEPSRRTGELDDGEIDEAPFPVRRRRLDAWGIGPEALAGA